MAFCVTNACVLVTGLISLSSLSSSAGAPLPAARRTAPYAGVYAYTGLRGASGRLTIYPKTDSTFLFYLSRDNGAPAHGSGELLRRARVYGTTTRYAFTAGYSPTAGCRCNSRCSPPPCWCKP